MTGREAPVLVVTCTAGRCKVALSGFLELFKRDLDGIAASIGIV